jgi:hypothetical protein
MSTRPSVKVSEVSDQWSEGEAFAVAAFLVLLLTADF